MGKHIVQPGEHISRLAFEHRLGSYESIWKHPENAALRKIRDPNVLNPGDAVFLPDREAKTSEASTEKRHTYKAKIKPLKLRLRVQDESGRPMAGARAELHIDGRVIPVKTGADGLIEVPIEPRAEYAELVLQEDNAFAGPVELRIGHLDPVDTVSGWIGRLNNLGYYAGPIPSSAGGETSPEQQRLLRSAIEEFQCDQGLTVDGICGPRTQKALKDLHGC